jgi:serine/threonine-protein kinase
VDTATAREIEGAIVAALAHSGAGGTVVVAGNQVELLGYGEVPVVIEVDHLSEQWPLLPPDYRQRKASEIARRLLEASGRASAGARGKRGSGVIIIPGGLIGAVAMSLNSSMVPRECDPTAATPAMLRSFIK